jgi:hypothetical protein
LEEVALREGEAANVGLTVGVAREEVVKEGVVVGGKGVADTHFVPKEVADARGPVGVADLE